jgi:hypothetical protein
MRFRDSYALPAAATRRSPPALRRCLWCRPASSTGLRRSATSQSLASASSAHAACDCRDTSSFSYGGITVALLTEPGCPTSCVGNKRTDANDDEEANWNG